MRKILLAAILFATLAIAAADLTGNWTGELQADGDPHPVFIVIKQDGNTLTGSGGPNESEQHPMENGKVVDGKIIFDVPAGGGSFHFELTLDGDTLKGAMQRKSDAGTQTGSASLKRVR